MRGLKVFGWVAAGVVALVGLLLLAVSLFVNPNDYRERIQQQVRTSTGRDLVLSGDIRLSVFPWVALQIGPATLGNPAGFDSEPFLAVQKASLRVRLLPLLRRELEVGRIEIDGLDLRLRKNAAGKGNWEDLGGKQTPPTSPADSANSPGVLRELDGISVSKGRISFDAITVSNLDVAVGAVSPRATVPIKASFDLDTGPGGSGGTFTSAFNLTPDQAAQRYAIDGLALGGQLKLKARTLAWKFSAASLKLDLKAQTLQAPAFSAELGPARLSGSLSGDKIVDAPVIGGQLRLEPLALREFLTQLGIELPRTRDAKALSQLALSATYSYRPKSMRLSGLDLQLDDSHLRGSLMLSNLDTLANEFELEVDRIDLDRYLSPAASPGAKSPEPAAGATQPDIELPTAPVRALDSRGNFGIGNVRFAGMTLTNVQVGIAARGGILHLSPLKAVMYGGRYSGDVTYDARGSAPALTMQHDLESVDMAMLLKDAAHSERLSGHGNASARLSGQGRSRDTLLRNLSGRVQTDLVDGAVNGIDLWFEINRAQALIKQEALPAGSDDRRTKFDSFRMSADIAGGIATTKDLSIASQLLRVTGNGTSNLVTEAINYHVVATILKAAPAAKGAGSPPPTLAGIPVEISGSMHDPKVRPDLSNLLKSNLQQKVQDTVKDKLRGLFGN